MSAKDFQLRKKLATNMLAQDGRCGLCGPNAAPLAPAATATGRGSASTATLATAAASATPSRWAFAASRRARLGPCGPCGCLVRSPAAAGTSCTGGTATKESRAISVARAAGLSTENVETLCHCAQCGANGTDGRFAPLHAEAD